MTFSDTYTLSRAGRYSSPLNSNDRLPLTYGDLTDGANGNWTLPCIDVGSHVYCYTAFAVLSVANGNAINVYVDGVLEAPANYTFSESNNYASKGIIATITFNADQGNKIVSARGKGKDDGGTLIENIIDILYDFLTVENSFTSADFQTTKKAMAADIFEAQGYKAAGVIKEDKKIWDILQQMMGSFLGSIYIDAEDKLTVGIEDGSSLYVSDAIIPKSETKLTSAKQRKSSVINRCAGNYAYNYAENEFSSHTDDSTYANVASQGIYGVCEPGTPYQFYWCRDVTSIQKMQQIITDKFGFPTWEIDFEDLSLKRSHVDAGDVVVATFDAIYLANGDQMVNQLIKILAVQPNFAGQNIKFNGIDTGLYLTAIGQLLDGSWLLDGTVLLGGARDTTVY